MPCPDARRQQVGPYGHRHAPPSHFLLVGPRAAPRRSKCQIGSRTPTWWPSQDVVSRIVDDDDATLAEAKISAERGKLRATYDRAKGSTGCGGRAVIVEGDADKDALQEVCRYGSQRRVCRRHASVIKIVYFCRKLPQSKSELRTNASALLR